MSGWFLFFAQMLFFLLGAWYFLRSGSRRKGGRDSISMEENEREMEKLDAMRQVGLTEPLTEQTRPKSVGEIVGQERGIRALRAALCGPNPQHIIIYGPPGVGKTAAARLVLEEAKGRRNSPFSINAKFVEVDATTLQFDERSIADPLLGSVHDPIYQGAGAFGQMGIPRPQPGAVSEANGGVLFIDEIGELHPIQMNRLLKVLLPQQADHLSDTQKITVELTSSGNKILSIRFLSEGTLMDTDKTVYTLKAELKPKSIDENFTIPDAVKETISSGNTEGEISISEDLFRLLSAWTTMSQEGFFAADVQLSVECDPISLSESMKYGQALAEGNKVSCVRKDDLAVYFAQETFCDQNGVLLTEQDSALIDRARLLEVLKQICLNGEFHCTDTGNSTWLYKLTLDENAMKTIAYAAAPEMQSMPVTLSSGSVQLTVSDGVTKEIECLCTGGLEGLAEAAPALFVPNRTRGELPRYPRLADFQSAV